MRLPKLPPLPNLESTRAKVILGVLSVFLTIILAVVTASPDTLIGECLCRVGFNSMCTDTPTPTPKPTPISTPPGCPPPLSTLTPPVTPGPAGSVTLVEPSIGSGCIETGETVMIRLEVKDLPDAAEVWILNYDRQSPRYHLFNTSDWDVEPGVLQGTIKLAGTGTYDLIVVLADADASAFFRRKTSLAEKDLPTGIFEQVRFTAVYATDTP